MPQRAQGRSSPVISNLQKSPELHAVKRSVFERQRSVPSGQSPEILGYGTASRQLVEIFARYRETLPSVSEGHRKIRT
ncbi:hypothetical protein Poly21_27170 [Allorhodopirellula heiligendammensis]|uniref:Uncharacterized protein n=1 Tax=Allorhodopirellula heiligendammensis TaxID=2714739 RepID=A0A5C6BTH4_9BACT|nr:hypothetical protein Poly21_27170 [Allorhodopirellula heiligendammensis]